MKQKYHTFLIAFASTLFLGSVYLYFSNELSSEAATTPSSSSGLTSSNTAQKGVTATGQLNNKINSDTAFLASLISLTKIKIDASLFENPSFVALRDNNVNLEAVGAGRPNPFAPIGVGVDESTVTVSLLPVITNAPSQITEKTAVLNGTINSEDVPTASYFEYGPTPSLGKTTANAAQSLVGTFIIKITGLTPTTTYFYRAVSKINGVVINGEILSFNTN